MVEMVVCDQDQIYAARLLRSKGRRHQPFRMRTEEGIDQHSGTVQMQRHTRLAEPDEDDRAWWRLAARELVENRRGLSDHVGLSCTLSASPARSVSAANAAAC